MGDGFRRCDQAEPFELGGVRQAAGLRRVDRHARKVGRVFVLEIEAAGDARGAAGGGVGAGAFAQPAGKVLVLDARQREPGLKITGRGFEGEKRGGGEGRELIGLEVVELDEGHAGPVRPHDDIALVGGCDVEHRGQGAAKIGEADVAAEQFLVAGARSSRSHRKRVAPTLAKASIIARASVCPVLALSSPMPRPCFILTTI